MPVDRKHIIQRQVLDFQWQDGRAGASLLEGLSEKFHRDVVPAMEKVFDNYITGSDFIMIDTLEIDLGNITPEQFENDLGAIIGRTLDKELKNRITQGKSFPGNGEAGVKVAGIHENMADTIVFYLQYGYFPWWGRIAGTKELKEKTGELITTAADDFRKKLAHAFRRRNARKRAAGTFDELLLDRVIYFLNPAMIRHTSLLLEAMDSVADRIEGSSKRIEKGELYQEILELLSRDAKIELKELIRDLIIHYAGETAEPAKRAGFLAGGLHESLKSLTVADRSAAEPALKEVEKEFGKGIRNGKSGKKEKKELEDKKAALEELRKQDREQQRSETPEGDILIPNVGMILVWPYLEQLFRSLDYLENKKFKGEAALNRAVFLLNELVYPGMEREEAAMVLNKVLCGVEISYPVDLKTGLSQKETGEGEKMLQALVSHWRKLKNTSLEGLREAFLVREGILRDDEGHWKLVVERKAYDMLLSGLPYQLSPVSLPWMKKILTTEW